jgi:hypothetical protein
MSLNSFQPTINPMLGPSQSALINLGASEPSCPLELQFRTHLLFEGFPPCMKIVQGVEPSIQLACELFPMMLNIPNKYITGLNDTANPPDRVCPLETVCGFGGFHGETPNQWFRSVRPFARCRDI